MDAKLTLKLDERAIAIGKSFAERNGKSLSRVVQDFFLMLEPDASIRKAVPVSPRLQALVGVASSEHGEGDYLEHLEEKYA